MNCSRVGWVLLVGLLCRSDAFAAEEPGVKAHGFVDGAAFTQLVDEEGVTLEVSLQGALLRALSSWDPELHQLVGGLESIHAVILELGEAGVEERARKLVRDTEKRLLGQGWERLARMRDGDAQVVVLVLNDEQTIQGLVVMVLDDSEHSVVFANVAGVIDLAAIEQLGERLDLPGLDDLSEETREGGGQ